MHILPEKETHGPGQRGPVFVAGMWRSGTSLFYALLNQNPQVALMYEDELPLLWPLFLSGKAKSDWPERWEFWNQAPSRHKISVNDLPRQVGVSFRHGRFDNRLDGGTVTRPGDGVPSCEGVLLQARFFSVLRRSSCIDLRFP